jgi:membrane protein implicated in regulation of membrane protease activity
MLNELFASGTLNLVYIGIVLLSFLYALITLLGAEIGDAFDLGLDVDSDTGIDFINISPFAMAMFGTTFGLVGLITRLWFEMDAIPSIIWAAVLGLVIGGAAQAFFIYVLSPSRSSHYNLSADAIGREAEVITTIPAGGVGEIAFNNVSGRVKLGARATDNQAIPFGTVVIIKRVVGRVAFVHPVLE